MPDQTPENLVTEARGLADRISGMQVRESVALLARNLLWKLADRVSELEGERTQFQAAVADRDDLYTRVSELEQHQHYREVWSDGCPPGGMVCSICGMPVETEPCSKHSPLGYVVTSQFGDGTDLAYEGLFSTAEDALKAAGAGPHSVHAVVRQAVTQ